MRDSVKKTRRVNRLAEREAARGEDDDCPKKVVEVFLRKDTGSEEKNEGNDSYDAHIAENGLELVAYAPEDNGE
jgi:hypothetical protein